MIYSLFGILNHIDSDFFVIECAGVGFKCKSDSRTIKNLSLFLNSEVKIFTKLVIRENACDLFGFQENSSIKVFNLLTSVTGVGPKAALSILSQFSFGELVSVINSGNISMLTCANGVGEKMSKRIVLELKEKVKNICEVKEFKNNKNEALNALEALGYSKNEVFSILEKLDGSLGVEDLIRLTLKEIGG